MRKVSLAVIAAVALASAVVFAQQGVQNPSNSTMVAVTATPGTTTSEATAAVNNAVTLTLTPPTGQFVYLCDFGFTVAADGTAGDVWTNLSFTSTNLGGWAYSFSANTSTANQLVLDKTFSFPGCTKAAAATTAVTIVSPTGKTHGKYDIWARWYAGS